MRYLMLYLYISSFGHIVLATENQPKPTVNRRRFDVVC